MVCGSLNAIDQGGGGAIQPRDGSAMAPRRSYHNEKLDIVHCLIEFPPATSNAVTGRAHSSATFTLRMWRSALAAAPRNIYLEDCKILRVTP